MPYPESFAGDGLLRGRLDESDGRVELALIGELDLSSADRLRARLDALGTRTTGDVILDVAEVTFIDSSGLRCLLLAQRGLGEGRRMVLRNPAPAVRRLLELIGVDGALVVE